MRHTLELVNTWLVRQRCPGALRLVHIEVRKRRVTVEIVEDVCLQLKIGLMVELLSLHELSWSGGGMFRLFHRRLWSTRCSWLGWCAAGLAFGSTSSLISCTAIQVHYDHIVWFVCKTPGASIEYGLLRLLETREARVNDCMFTHTDNISFLSEFVYLRI